MATLIEWDTGTTLDLRGTVENLEVQQLADYPVLVLKPGSGAAFAQWDNPDTAATQITMRLYLHTAATWGGAALNLGGWYTLAGGGGGAQLRIAGSGSPGQIRLAAGGIEVVRSSQGLLSNDTEYRFELQHDFTAQTARVACWQTQAAGGGLVYDSGTLAAPVEMGTTSEALRLGRFSDTPTCHLSRIMAVDELATIGPHATDTGGGGGVEVLGVWNGSATEGVDVLGTWNGTSLEPVNVLGAWNGSAVV